MTAGDEEEEDGEGEGGEEQLLSTQTIVAKAARWEMRVTRQRTTSPAESEDEAVSPAALAAARLTTETSGRWWFCFVLFRFGEGEGVKGKKG